MNWLAVRTSQRAFPGLCTGLFLFTIASLIAPRSSDAAKPDCDMHCIIQATQAWEIAAAECDDLKPDSPELKECGEKAQAQFDRVYEQCMKMCRERLQRLYQ